MIEVAASGSAEGILNICAQQHVVVVFFKCLVLCTLYSINSSIATKVDSTYFELLTNST